MDPAETARMRRLIWLHAGRNRLKIIRRCIKVGSKEQWEWIDTSAILSPDVPHNPDYYPKVEEARFKELPGNVYEIRSVYFYKIPGTQCYLDVRNEFVVADAMSGTKSDKTKRICKILRYKMKSDNTILYTAALCAESKMRYIGVGQGNQVKLDENPFWFEVKYIGDNIKFKTNEMFLACNTNTFKTEVHRTEYWFEEFLADEGQDHPDCVEMPCGDGISLPLSRNISSDESSCSNGMSRSLCRCLSLSEYVG